MIITEILSAATAAGEAERARYRRFIDGETGDGTPVWVVASETNDAYHCFGTEADCLCYIADRGYAARDAYLAKHAGDTQCGERSLRAYWFDVAMRLLADAGDSDHIRDLTKKVAGAGEGGNDAAG